MRTHRYRITIAGGLGKTGREAFPEFLIESSGGNTVLIGDLDQPALYGALNRMLSLGLEVVELSRLTAEPGCGREAERLLRQTSPGAADATGFHEVEAEQPDPFQQAVQVCLIELPGDDRDLVAACHVQVGESRGAGLVEPALNADLVDGLPGFHDG